MTGYETKSTEALIHDYIWEKGRINEFDRVQTQQIIKRELKHRYERLLRLLDDDELRDPEEAAKIIKYDVLWDWGIE